MVISLRGAFIASFVAGAALAVACGGRTVGEDEGSAGPPGLPGPPDPDGVDPEEWWDASANPGDGSVTDARADRDADADADADGCSRFVTAVVEHHFGPGQSHNQRAGFPQALYGPPFAGDIGSVVSLGNGGYVVVAFGDTAIVDGPGIDFTVFENPLAEFEELATVAVSEDGVRWTSFPCTWRRGDSESDYGSCAGVKPVLSSPLNGVDPTDPNVSGGDGFDLHAIGVSRARFVRITDRPDLDGDDGVFDLDAVAVVHADCL